MERVNFGELIDLNSLVVEKFSIGVFDCELLELSRKLKNQLLKVDDYNLMVKDAADYGMSEEGLRIIEDPKKMPQFDKTWDQVHELIESDPTIRNQVGVKVCEMSGLEDHLADLAEKKEAEELAELEAKEEAERAEKERLEQDGIVNISGDHDDLDVDMHKIKEDYERSQA